MDAWVWLAAPAWYGVMSAIALVMYWRDKRAAQRRGWRTPERMLHVVALLGGWPGALLGQRVFRHKTRKRWFRAVTVAIVLLHMGAWIALLIVMARSAR